MSKNRPQQREVHTRPVDLISKDETIHYDRIPRVQAEGPTYIITHDSKAQQRPPHTEIVHGNIEQWVKNNPELYIINIYKI
jgi:hypothetical protein